MTQDASEVANGNPAIDRMAALLEQLETSPDGLDLNTLARRASVTRSSAYRILNSLDHHGFVRRISHGRYVLGGRLQILGEAVASTFTGRLLPELMSAHLEKLGLALGETVRLSVHDRGGVFLIAGFSAPTSHALSYTVGQEVPLHAGAGSKVLAAYLKPQERELLLSRKLERYTDRTITDPDELRRELDAVAERGWAHDPGEFSLRVQSYGCPLRMPDGQVVAALSVPFMANDSEAFHKNVLAELLGEASRAERTLAEAFAR
jgi:DNA-binding IclR family transcriptional regulator